MYSHRSTCCRIFLPITDLFMEVYDDPDGVKEAAMLSAKLLVEFLNKQKAIIGDALASPGHGFASSRLFRGIGLSDDNSIMVAGKITRNCFSRQTSGLENGLAERYFIPAETGSRRFPW